MAKASGEPAGTDPKPCAFTESCAGTGTHSFAGTNADDEASFWSVQAGIEKKWLPLGKTTIYGGSNEVQRNIIAQMILGL